MLTVRTTYDGETPPVDEQVTSVAVDGRSVFVREWGSREARSFLFLHGSGDDGSRAAPLAAAMADGWHVVAPDAPGHGRSERTDPDAYAPSRVAELMVGVLDAVGVGRAAVGGFSWGASIACQLAARHPERVSMVVLLEGGHIDFADVRDFDVAAVGTDAGVGAATARGLLEEPVVGTYPTLRESGVPLLLVTALRDEALDQLHVDPLRRLEQEVPQATIVRVAARGHDLLADDDGDVVRAVREWLTQSG